MTSKLIQQSAGAGEVEKFPAFPPRGDMENFLHMYRAGSPGALELHPKTKRKGCVMKNITVSVDDETHRSAKEWAAKRGTSVSALVREYLNSLPQRCSGPPERTLSEVIADLRARGVRLSSADNVPREELYDRNALR